MRGAIACERGGGRRVRADVYGIKAVDYESDMHVAIDELYKGWRELVLSPDDIQTFYKKRELQLEQMDTPPHPHEYFVLKDKENEKNTALAKWDHVLKKIVPILELAKGLWGVMPRNKEQRFAICFSADSTMLHICLRASEKDQCA